MLPIEMFTYPEGGYNVISGVPSDDSLPTVFGFPLMNAENCAPIDKI